MITAVRKEDGQWFAREELLSFPREELLLINELWMKYSHGKWGFSAQKRVYANCGAPSDGNCPGQEIWYEFCDRVGWREGNSYVSYANVSYANLTCNPLDSSEGKFSFWGGWVGFSMLFLSWFVLFSRPDL